MTFQLTAKNYHSKENTKLSNSKIGDFLVSKEFYYFKHIAKTYPREVTKPMKIGLMVDDLFSEGKTSRFSVKVLKKDDAAEYERLKEYNDEDLMTQAEYEEALGRAEAIMREPFYQWLKDNNGVFQYPLEGVIKHKGKEIEICGMADVITETADIVYIDDGKSTNLQKVKSTKKWLFSCIDMGYLRQLAVYTQLWKQMHRGDRRKIVCRHFTVYEAKKSVYKTKLFVIPQSMLRKYWNEFVDTAIAISETTDWHDEPVTWDKAQNLRTPTIKKEEVTSW